MKSHLRICKIVTTLAAMTLSASMLGQFNKQGLPNYLNETGEGTLARSGRPAMGINRVEMRLFDDRTCEITIIGRERHRLLGRYTRVGNNATISINGAFGDPNATANGVARFVEDRRFLSELTLSGRSGRDTFNIDFYVRDNYGGGSFNANLRETGTGAILRSRLGSDSLTRAELELKTNGEFFLNVFGRERYGFKGRWNQESRTRIRLRVVAALGDSTALGEGYAELTQDRRSLTEVGLKGSAGGHGYSVGFHRTATGPGQPGVGGGSNFSFASTRNVSGVLNFGSYRLSANRAQIAFFAIGTFELRIMNDQAVQVITGRYTRRSNSEISLSIQRAFEQSATGTGTVFFNRNGSDFTTITVNGTADRRSFSGTFR
jgi:hypothetical protein